jgi:hypothetical protein
LAKIHSFGRNIAVGADRLNALAVTPRAADGSMYLIANRSPVRRMAAPADPWANMKSAQFGPDLRECWVLGITLLGSGMNCLLWESLAISHWSGRFLVSIDG